MTLHQGREGGSKGESDRGEGRRVLVWENTLHSLQPRRGNSNTPLLHSHLSQCSTTWMRVFNHDGHCSPLMINANATARPTAMSNDLLPSLEGPPGLLEPSWWRLPHFSNTVIAHAQLAPTQLLQCHPLRPTTPVAPQGPSDLVEPVRKAAGAAEASTTAAIS